MSLRHPKLEAVAQRDGRYAYEAYEFLFEALEHTQLLRGQAPAREKGEPSHVTGRDLLDGVCDLARRQFGLMARTVFRLWGVERTEDFGRIVFSLVDEGLMSKTETDSLSDFQDVYDLDEVLVKNYRIELEEGADV